MKRLRQTPFVILLLSWILPDCIAADPPSIEKLQLKGHVRSVVEDDLADNISSEPKGTSFHTRRTYFSPDGAILLFEDCASDCERIDFFWQLGRLVEERHQFENHLPDRMTKYVWDAEGNVEEEQTFENGSLECTKRFHKDSLQDEESEYCGDSLTSRVVRKHDAVTGDVVSWYSYSYPGKEILEMTYIERKVQMDGGMVKTEQLVGGNVHVSTIRDTMGRIVEELRISDAAYHRETHKFDVSGREIEKAEWARDGTNINRRAYIYEDDMQGNWIRRTELFSSSAMSESVEGEVTVRAINYY